VAYGEMSIITLLTDFGSFYPAQMKGVILSKLEGKDVTFVDIAHDIPPQDVRAGAFALLSSASYFPTGTIHIAVVDPGVGTKRRGLVVESGGQLFVGPDNGLLIPAARSLGQPNPTRSPSGSRPQTPSTVATSSRRLLPYWQQARVQRAWGQEPSLKH